MKTDRTNNPELPEDLRDLEAALDSLGERMRASPPDELGRRITDAGAQRLSRPRAGGLRLTSGATDKPIRTHLRHEWALAASAALLIVAVFVAISVRRPGFESDPPTNAPITSIDEAWIEFETAYVADPFWSEAEFEALAEDIEALEVSLNTEPNNEPSLEWPDGEWL